MAEQKTSPLNRRILVIDDTEAIHADFEKILTTPAKSKDEASLDALDELFFPDDAAVSNRKPAKAPAIEFQLSHARQGEDGTNQVTRSVAESRPFALAFVDMRMPPGWDGLKTIEEIWKADRNIQIVICSAYSDYTWEEIILRLGKSEHLLILKKPFDKAEVYQMAVALTEKWNIQQTSTQLMDTLERKVEERTSELSQVNQRLQHLNNELGAAVQDAECAARAKGRFLATMSHEIRTTLNGIMGASYMLNNSASLAAQDREFASIIQSSSESLMTIINDILDYSKYESGQLKLESVPFSLTELAQECGTLLASLIQKNQIQYTFQADPNLPAKLIGDPSRIRQIILNLLNNAIKFSQGKSVDLILRLKSSQEENARIEIQIADTGIGMDAETQERLFNAFMQADSSTTRQFGGTGLGLAICRLLSDAMQGTISVESQLGKGSRFTFSVPLLVDFQSPAPAQDAPARTNASTTISAGKRVLTVDDNGINRKLATHFLAMIGVKTDLAENGAEALRLHQSNPYDIILMDLQMPVLDGFDATAKIRQAEKQSGSARTPIIALTANAFKEVRSQCIDVGFDDFITKPLRIDELREILSKWLNPVARSSD